METPHGDVPDRFVKDMNPAEMADFLQKRYGRRHVLRGAAVLGVGAVAGPVLWRQSKALASIAPIGPRWLTFGSDPRTEMCVSWSSGIAFRKSPAPPAPRVRWGVDKSYGSSKEASSTRVAVPSKVAGEAAENTFYNSLRLTGLSPATKYHYSVSNDGATWSPDVSFTTGVAARSDYSFTAFGDEAAGATAAPMVRLAASRHPAFHLVTGDLSYASPGLKIPDTKGFDPGQWDKYLGAVGPAGAQSIPWQASVGAHEIEPLGDHGYAGFVTRFPHNYDSSSGSPVVYQHTNGNVAFIHLDANDVSAQDTLNAGYTGGRQTAWLSEQLASYRAPGRGVDFVVVVCNCCCYSSNREHGSDGGLRGEWGPLFDKYHVDLVLSGHVHAYERTNPMRAGQPTKKVGSGGTVNPVSDGTTYICVGGGGARLYDTWYGTTDKGDPGNSTPPKLWVLNSSGKPVDKIDSSKGYSACRYGLYTCLVVDVKAPAGSGSQTSMLIRAMMPAQSKSAIQSITDPKVMDSVTLVRTSR
jgi:hypothetical protein